MKINGRIIAEQIFEELKEKVRKLQEKNIIPHLAIVLVGDDPASKSYVRQKMLTAEKVGIKTSLFQYPDSAATKDLLKRLNDLNHLSKIHGVIVQQPLPLHINLKKITEAIDPEKDVDGFHPQSKFQPPIALAVLRILKEVYFLETKAGGAGGRAPNNAQRIIPKEYFERALAGGKPATGPAIVWLKSKKIVIIGKGETGGQPIIQTLKKMGIEPTVIDSKTKNPQSLTKTADIIISAVGKSNIIKPEMIKKGVVLISIGLHKGPDGKLHGDYEEEQIKNIASFYTPTPGGVGPVNVAILLKNLVTAAGN